MRLPTQTPSMKLVTEATLYRDAADVKRYHCKRTLREQTVGQHTFGVLMLLRVVWPGARPNVIWAAMKHDLPELFTGDVPAPIKRADPILAERLNAIERELEPLHEHFGLTEFEELLLKWADRMELVLWCIEEHKMGNTYMDDTIRRGMGWIMAGRIPDCCEEFTKQVLRVMESINLRPAVGAELEMQR